MPAQGDQQLTIPSNDPISIKSNLGDDAVVGGAGLSDAPPTLSTTSLTDDLKGVSHQDMPSSSDLTQALNSVQALEMEEVPEKSEELDGSLSHLTEQSADPTDMVVPPSDLEAVVPMQDPNSPITPPPMHDPNAQIAELSSTTTPDPTVPNPPPTGAIGFGANSQQSVLDVLLADGDITPEQQQTVEVERISSGKPLEEIVEEKGIVSEEVLTKAKSKLHNIEFVKIADTGTDPQALSQLPEVVARSYHILPLSYNKAENTLVVAMLDPLDLSAIDFAQQKSGLKIIAKYAMKSELSRAIAEHYSQSLSGEVTAALEQTSQIKEDKKKKQDLSALSGETIRQAPITKIVQTIVAFAMKARASDVHIEPQESRTRVRYRIDGILSEKLILPSTVHEAVVSRIKILSDLKIDEKRLPQDGRFNFISDDEEVDLRVSTLPTIHGEKVVMRLLKKDTSVPTLPQLGLDGLALRNLEDSIKVPHGIILVTGPTGSGKTTTLYSILHNVNTPKVNIVTLEDPVEYEMKGVNQVQINPQAGLTFASGLRSFLRQDPNVIMVGEVRDSETAELAVQASLTGHLVFSTLHTSSSAGAIPRLLDMGAEPFLLASSMTCVVAQRVLRRINENFKEEYKPEPAVLKDIKEVLGHHLDAWMKRNNKTMDTLTLFRAKKDLPQNETEYKGRVAIFEVMKVTDAIAQLVLERKPASDLEEMAMKDGMLLMKQDGYLKALEGVTTIEEVLRVAQI